MEPALTSLDTMSGAMLKYHLPFYISRASTSSVAYTK